MRAQKIIKRCTAVMSCCALLLVCFAAKAQEAPPRGVSPELHELLVRCAPSVDPETMAAVVSGESRGHQFAIADAGPVRLPWKERKLLVRSLYPGSLSEAVATAQSLIAKGHTVSLGLAQVNDRNLRRLGLSLRDIFDPCTNIAAGGKILTDFYEKAAQKFGQGTPETLRAALSAYNSGDWIRGDKDGYVDMVYGQVGKPLTVRTSAVVPRLSTTLKNKSSTPNRAKPTRTAAAPRTFPLQVSEFAVSQ